MQLCTRPPLQACRQLNATPTRRPVFCRYRGSDNDHRDENWVVYTSDDPQHGGLSPESHRQGPGTAQSGGSRSTAPYPSPTHWCASTCFVTPFLMEIHFASPFYSSGSCFELSEPPGSILRHADVCPGGVLRCHSVLLCLLEKRVDFKQAKVRWGGFVASPPHATACHPCHRCTS